MTPDEFKEAREALRDEMRETIRNRSLDLSRRGYMVPAAEREFHRWKFETSGSDCALRELWQLFYRKQRKRVRPFERLSNSIVQAGIDLLIAHSKRTDELFDPMKNAPVGEGAKFTTSIKVRKP